MKHLNIKVLGKVQGVFMRDTLRKEAEMRKIRGFVRNEPDGSVYAEVEGEGAELEGFLDSCRKGTQFSEVEHVVISEGSLKDFKEFTII